jgi:hypothetical protein
MLTIKKLKQVEKEFEGLNYEEKTFEKLDEMLDGVLSKAKSEDTTDTDTPEGLVDMYYYVEAFDGEERVNVIVFLTFDEDDKINNARLKVQ